MGTMRMKMKMKMKKKEKEKEKEMKKKKKKKREKQRKEQQKKWKKKEKQKTKRTKTPKERMMQQLIRRSLLKELLAMSIRLSKRAEIFLIWKPHGISLPLTLSSLMTKKMRM